MGERLTIGEICTRSVTIAFRRTSLSGAARLMRDNHVGCLVVVEHNDGRQTAVGILTDRDLVTAVVAPELDINRFCVEDVMSTDLVCAREDDSLIDLMRTMRREGVRRIPVVGPQRELLGVVTLDDALDVLAEELCLLVGTVQSGKQRERNTIR
ncbi:CBS domain-containing protein [Rhodoferax lacus]|uniref:CBS domain-containing protein n=2 Tax=Rhodoferax lacus TaxID=2184758 RepID=A0A3E1R628_9BURK|nr:CBS domain-containing protein [Rhodoferax lacus]